MRVAEGTSEYFEIGVDVYQRSAASPLLLIVAMEEYFETGVDVYQRSAPSLLLLIVAMEEAKKRE